MIEGVSGYVSIVCILTTFLTIGFLFYAIKQTVYETAASKLLVTLIAFWIIFQAILSSGRFYLQTESFPPRLAVFALLPALVLIITFFIFFRESFIEKLPLKILTLLHVVRIPVELVLFWLYQNKQVPQLMTFEGRNFDILVGITAPIITWLAFRNGKTNSKLLLTWNIAAFLFLVNIVAQAIMSLPSPIQQMAFDQPNRAVLYFPYVWLPAIIVPIVLFAHLASFWKIYKNQNT